MKNNKKRLKEIISVLKKYKITKGITPEKCRKIVEELGPTFIKIGQIMSMRTDILPQDYCEELKKLQSNVAPMNYDTVKSIIEETYDMPIDMIFKKFDPIPIGSASIAQVHKAILKDGRLVVAKIQRKDIYESMYRDINLLKKALSMTNLSKLMGNVIDFNMVLDEMWEVALQEMDFLIEASNMEKFKRNNKDILYVSCPYIEKEYTNSKILVMEYIDGIRIDNIEHLKEEGYDLSEIGIKLANNYIKQLLEDGFFHADPHPGNIWIRGRKIYWIDLGMVGTLSTYDKEMLMKVVEAFVEKDINKIKSVLLIIGRPKSGVNEEKLYNDLESIVNKYSNMPMREINLTVILEEFMAIAKEHSITMPKGISLFTRGLLTIQGVMAMLSPDIDLIEILTNFLNNNFIKSIDVKKEILSIGKEILYSSKKSISIVSELSNLINMTIKGQSKINLKIIRLEESLNYIDKMVNKIIVAVITAGLLIGSSLICTTNMKIKIFDIPLLGFLGFLVALILGGILIVDIVKK
ncbi:ABC1 family protein [Clostridium bornimense]|uniref:ABC1 family protein n=1 Tax=Clostridium bornimense TaxID=1216932 RepID=W6S1P1_9CLOT|nr:AarF/UbiB family protein [Clostridium bornimense]CDM68212.1 ABC1 family protein [Clostridium bornimense]